MAGKAGGGLAAVGDWLKNPKNRHWKLALYWPFYSAAYVLIGKLGGRIDPICTSLPLDYSLPFVPAFIVPYLLWFPFWVGVLVYGLIQEPRLFRRTMHFFMLTCTIAVCVFWLFPTSPGLRPDHFEREDIFTRITRFVYWVDADRNGLPSEHIIGLFAVLFAVWDSDRISTRPVKLAAAAIALIIAASTMLVKQHAMLDVAAAVPVSLLGWFVCFHLPRKREGRQK